MRAICIITLTALFFLPACKNANMHTPQSLVGTWELQSRRGGNIMPATFQKGDKNLLQFTDTTYELYENGTLVAKGPYTVQVNQQGQNVIVYGSDTTSKEYMTLNKDTLVLQPTHPDVATRIYTRIH